MTRHSLPGTYLCFVFNSLHPVPLKRKKVVSSRAKPRPSPAAAPVTPDPPVILMPGTYVDPNGGGQPSQPEISIPDSAARDAAMARNVVHQHQETADLATFEAAERQKIKDEAFDDEGYMLPGFKEHFHGVPPPPSSSRHPTGSFVVRDDFIFRPKEVMDEGFSYMENQFRRYSQDFLHMLGRVRLMSTVRLPSFSCTPQPPSINSRKLCFAGLVLRVTSFLLWFFFDCVLLDASPSKIYILVTNLSTSH